MKKIGVTLLAVLFALFMLVGSASPAFADAAQGDVIISLGEDLTPAQKEKILIEMNAPDNATILTVSNKEEHEALGAYIPKAQIGTRAFSSAKITITGKGSGINVESKNIIWVSNAMYENALITAGVTDADIYVTGPFEVTGTAALTGIMKAYEESTGEKIPEELKQIANEEMVEIAELGEDIGKDEATALAAAIKEELAKDMPKNSEEMQALIADKAEELNINIDDKQLADLTALYDKMKEIDIDWGAVGDQISATQEKLEKFINSDEAKGFFEGLWEFVKDVFDAIVTFFSGLFSKE